MTTRTTDEERLQQLIERRDQALAKVIARIKQLRVLVRQRGQREDRRRLDNALGRRDQALAKANARIGRLRARIRQRGRREDTRRKVLAGAMLLEHVAHDRLDAMAVWRQMSDYLGRAGDRTLFGLPPQPDGRKLAMADVTPGDVEPFRRLLRERGTSNTRCKILVGAMLLDQVKAKEGAIDDKMLLEFMHAFLAKPADRALFGLPPLAQQTGDGAGHNNNDDDDDNGRSSS